VSIHAKLSPESQARLRAQQRNATITSVIIAILSVLLLGILLLWILLPRVETYTPEIVSYQGNPDEEQKTVKRELSRAVQRKPSAPSSSMARVIAANTQSNVAVPVPEVDVPDPSTEFGDGDDFGDGWGDGDFDSGGGATTFFGQEVKGERILYVIDYSLSMRGRREELMRIELAKSVMKLPGSKQYQIIMFAGPAWVGGDKVKMAGNKSATIQSQSGQAHQWKGEGAGNWRVEGEVQKSDWLYATDDNIFKSEELAKTHKLIYGTNWENPLEMAFAMDPLPNVIVFMTDGLSPGDPVAVAKDFASRAKKENIVINTIALMEPKAAEAMEALAEGSRGEFSLINEAGDKIDPGDIKIKKAKDKKKRQKKK